MKFDPVGFVLIAAFFSFAGYLIGAGIEHMRNQRRMK